jgi:2-polyprenyl-3-methyl-5-hydroxy-6-metoxy-1,4-benzoquinol methylase
MLCQAVPTTEEALTARLVQSTTHALELYGIYLGKELGLYAVLNARGPMTPLELARAAGIASRYAREWLEQQAVAGLLQTEGSSEAADDRKFSLPAEHVNVLVTEDHPAHLAPLSQMVAGIGGALDRVARAYRTGAGVAYQHYGAAFRSGQAGINRPAFVRDLTTRWIPAAPDLHAALTSRRLRVADVGCGAGWSTQAMARAFPLAEVIGFDADEASIDDARRYAADQGVGVHYALRDATTLAEAGPFDVALVLEALHDMSRPLEVLQSIREALTPGGSVLVADEKVGEHFHAPADAIERLMYGWSIVHCLPVSLAEQPSTAIGTVIRP